jgi:hypothetical protein
MTENLEWKGRIVVQVSDVIAPLEINHRMGLALTNHSGLDVLAARYNVFNVTKLIPWAEKPEDTNITDISRFYILEFPYEVDLHEVIEAYNQIPAILTAEPYFIRKSDYIPSDPYFSNQWGLNIIGADVAFDYTLGSTDLVVGVVDSGTDTLHEDLKDNLWINPGEDLNGNGIIDVIEWNGIDDDSNNFVDDFWGWDLWLNSNNVQDTPISQGGGHGTHCAGDADAVTDNGIGIASLGCIAKIMTARAGDGEYVYAGTQGINYCIDNGSNVISLSWGGTSYSSYEQTIVNNAWDNGVLIFASAGNENNAWPHYPSSYQNVLSVAATNPNDQKAGFSNYGADIDICAPGTAIMSTTPGNTYYSWSGTSMSCPLAAGLALLTWAARPEFTNGDVMVQILNNCVDIDPLNPGYAGQLGWGRIDAAATISSLYPNLSYSQMEFNDDAGNGDGRPDPGETVDFLITLDNTSDNEDATDVEVTLECDDPDITFINNSNYFSSIPQNSTVNNHSEPIQFTVSPDAVPHEATFVLTTHEGGFELTWTESFLQMIGRPEILIVADDNGSGNHTWYDQDLRALGTQPDIWEVAENGIIPDTELSLYPTVFWHTSNEDDPLIPGEQSLIEDFLNAGGNLLLVGEDIDEQFAGTPFYSDVLHAVSTGGTGVPQVSGVEGDPITNGFTLLLAGSGGAGNNQSPSTIDAVGDASLIFQYTTSGAGAGISWGDGLSKLIYLSFNFESVSGNSPTLRTEAISSFLGWFGVNPVQQPSLGAGVPTAYALEQNYPNPFNPTTEIAFSLPRAGHVKLSIYNLSGREVATLINDALHAGRYSQTFDASRFSSGVYVYRLETQEYTATQKMILLK